MRLATVLCDEGKENSLRQGAPAKTGSKTSRLLQISSAQCKQKASLCSSGTRELLYCEHHIQIKHLQAKEKQLAKGFILK